MNTRKGIVHGTENGLAWILARREGACEDCTHGGCCTVVDGHNRIMVRAVNAVGAQPGDTVQFYMRENIKRKWMAILFAAPVITTILGALVGNLSAISIDTNPDSIGAVGAVFGLAAGLLLVRFLASSRKAVKELTPIIVDRVSSDR